MGKPLDRRFKVVSWSVFADTLEGAENFCDNHVLRGKDSQGNEVYECLGHDWIALTAARIGEDGILLLSVMGTMT